MIDPPKATKGRSMCKKNRKKTSKLASARTTRAQSARSTKKQAAPPRPSKAKKSVKKSTRKTGDTVPRASQKGTSKQLKSSGSAKPARSKAAAAGAAKDPPISQAQPNHSPATQASELREGAKAPAFRLPRDGGDTVSLSDYSGKKLVLFFYPRADTPGCTKETIDFTRLSGAFVDSRIAVLGVSADPLKAQAAFRDKHQLSIPLASDETHEMLEAYGVWGEKSMYGKTFLGILRTTVLVGIDGKIARIWRSVKVDGHADEVLAAARAL